ncbi:MAG: PilZ domain-containing protein [Lachnospiraceae bacterium]|nr:PilZ domain-containing protein [Lachnospiraceae bacterium]
MGIKLAEIEEEERIILHISNKENSMDLDAILKKHVKDNIALIQLEHPTTKRLIFDNVQVDMEYYPEDGVPILWHNAKIVNYKTDYVLQVASDGVRHNRRGCFRVAVAKAARLRMMGRGTTHVMIKDISITGFSISDRKMDLGFNTGDRVPITLEDLGFKLELEGRVVRIEEREDMIIYGLEICNLCKDLSSYVSVKQRRNSKQ